MLERFSSDCDIFYLLNIFQDYPHCIITFAYDYESFINIARRKKNVFSKPSITQVVDISQSCNLVFGIEQIFLCRLICNSFKNNWSIPSKKRWNTTEVVFHRICTDFWSTGHSNLFSYFCHLYFISVNA